MGALGAATVHSGALTQLTTELTDYDPSWSVDGTKLVFQSGTPAQLYSIDADGTGRTRLTNTAYMDGFATRSR